MFKDRLHLVGLVVRQGASRTGRALRIPVRFVAAQRVRPPERLLIAPQDIRTSDPTIAADVYAGYFAFGGKIVNAHGRSPFELEPRSAAWARSLAGFGWLRHLRAADTALARANARALVDDFLTYAGRPARTPAWEPAVVARRMLAWLSQSPIILEGADRDFYRRFMKALARAQVFLEAELANGLAGEARLRAVIALVELGLCAQGSARDLRRTTKLLADELDAQILPDGGHIGRNPRTLLDLLPDLLPLRQVFAARGMVAPPQLLNSIDRMMPMLRLFRHGDGPLALFNGMGVTPPELLATILAYDDARAMPLSNAPHSGYQRVEADGALLVIDAGRPPPGAFSSEAHAGCLAFEFSIDSQPVIVNCGAPDPSRAAAREAARTTAAHSTLVIDDTSSCRFAFHAGLQKWLGDRILAGPEVLEVERRVDAQSTVLRVSHDGYAARFGLVHERRLTLHASRRLDGEDRLLPAKGAPGGEDHAFALRFHIHPAARLNPTRDGHSIQIDLPDNSRWIFEVQDANATIEDSIFFAAPDGPRGSEQIVVHAHTRDLTAVSWSLREVQG